MAPGSNKYDSVLWKIARNPEISPDACWEELETWLESYKVEIKSQNADDWVKSLDRIRRKIDGIKNSASATRSPRSTRSPSTESDRQPDNDSGYGPSDKSDQLEVVFILAGGIETYPDGKVPLTCCYSDKYDEDYITDEACKRIGNPRIGRDGKVTLPYILSSETKSAEGIFAVIKYDDGEADVGFKIKGTEETPEAPVEERDGDLVLGIMHPLVEDQSSGVLTRRRTHESTDIPFAVGAAFQPQAAQVKTRAEIMDLGRKISMTVEYARRSR